MDAISLFSGAGGMDIGILQAGYEILACLEVDPYCCETLRSAIEREKRNTQVLEVDIRTVEPEILMEKLGLQPGELDLLFGGPPCQAFSQIGKQNSLDDERGMLLFQMVRFAEVLRPKAVMIEQVKGLKSAKNQEGLRGGVLDDLVKALKVDLGYSIVESKLLLAADYGVPQLRERVFIVAIASSEATHSFPEPTHRPRKMGLLDLPPYTTVGEVIKDLDTPAPKNQIVSPENSHMDVTPAGDRRRIHGVPEGLWLSSQRHLPPEQLCNLTKKDTTKFRRLSNKEPSITLRGGEIFFHPVEDRILTPREYMRIHGYPDEYILKGPIRSRSGRVRFLDQHRQVANSVPPPVAKVVAESIKRTLEQCQKSSRCMVID